MGALWGTEGRVSGVAKEDFLADNNLKEAASHAEVWVKAQGW